MDTTDEELVESLSGYHLVDDAAHQVPHEPHHRMVNGEVGDAPNHATPANPPRGVHFEDQQHVAARGRNRRTSSQSSQRTNFWESPSQEVQYVFSHSNIVPK